MPLSLPQSKRLARSVCAAAAVLIVASVGSLVSVGWSKRVDAIKDGKDKLDLLARVLEDQATRSVEAAAFALGTLAQEVQVSPRQDAALLQPLLAQALVAQPNLRGLAVLDADGQVVASSDPREQGLRLMVSRLGRLPAVGREPAAAAALGPRFAQPDP